MDKKFKYNLEGLLKLRKFKEKKVKVELGEIVQGITKLEADIRKLKKDLKIGYESQEKVLETDTKGKMVNFYPLFFDGITNHIKQKENIIFSLQKKYQIKVREMEKAMGDVKVIENLKSQKIEEHKKIMNKKEMDEIEEMNRIRKVKGEF